MSLRHLTRLSPDSFVGAALRAPLRLIPRDHVTSVRAGINRGARWIVGSGTHGCWLGTYEAEKQGLVARRVRPGSVVWDVGANAGFYTLAFSRLVGPTGRVVAIEPLAENVDHLLRHVRLNRADNVQVVQAAVADRTGLAGFAVEASNAMGHLTSRASEYLVPTLTADDLLAQLPGPGPDLIKIDIEGAEAAFLAGADRLLRHRAPELLVALHGEAQGQACVSRLRSHGYALYELDGSDAAPVLQERGELHALRPPGSRLPRPTEADLAVAGRPAEAIRERLLRSAGR